MRVLTITKGEEFKVLVKDKIEDNDIFIEEYRTAAKKLNDVILASQNALSHTKKKN